jgi:hypothetical protein
LIVEFRYDKKNLVVEPEILDRRARNILMEGFETS